MTGLKYCISINRTQIAPIQYLFNKVNTDQTRTTLTRWWAKATGVTKDAGIIYGQKVNGAPDVKFAEFEITGMPLLLDAGIEPIWMYSRRVSHSNTQFMFILTLK